MKRESFEYLKLVKGWKDALSSHDKIGRKLFFSEGLSFLEIRSFKLKYDNLFAIMKRIEKKLGLTPDQMALEVENILEE